MNETGSMFEGILSSLSGEGIEAADLDFYSLFRRQGEAGRIFFNQRRAIIFDVDAMGTLRQQLLETLGQEATRTILTRFGYAQGYKDAETLAQTFDWESDTEWLTAGTALQGLVGFVHVEAKKIEFDRDAGTFHMHGIWHNSYEAEAHLNRYDPSPNPVCWVLTGYASGYVTRFLEREVVAIETKCLGQGDEHCCFEIRPVDQWGSEADPNLEILKAVALPDGAEAKAPRDSQHLILFEDTGTTTLTETATLYETARRINEASDLQEVVAAVVEMGPVSVIDRAALQFFAHDAAGELEALIVVANWQRDDEISPLPRGTSQSLEKFPDHHLFLRPDPIFFDDVQHDKRLTPETIGVMQQRNIRAMAVLPLWVGLGQLGLLMLESKESYHFAEHEIQPYVALIRQLGIALENQQLLAEAHVVLAEVKATQPRNTIQGRETYPARPESRRYELVRSDDEAGFGGDVSVEVGEKVIRHRQKTEEIIPSLAPPVDRRGQEKGRKGTQERAERIEAEEVKSSLLVPLTVRGEVIGTLGLEEIFEREWTAEEKALVEAVARQLAQAAENLWLIDETQQRLERERRVIAIGEKIRTARSLEEALQVALKEVGVSLNASETPGK